MKSNFTGLLALYADKILAGKDYYKKYIAGTIDSSEFYEAMLGDASLSQTAGFTHREQKRLISLTPADDKFPADTIMKYLTDRNAVPQCGNMYEGFDEYRSRIRRIYSHGDFYTTIFPEDERLLYAVSKVTNPKNVFMAGCYYGYFAVWAMKAVTENGGMCVLSDVDREVCELAEENFRNLGYGDFSKVCCEDSVKLLSEFSGTIDILILDALGRFDDPRPEYRGKQIYRAMLKAAKHCLVKGSAVVIHNMRPNTHEAEVLENDLKSMNADGMCCDTYNGVGVYVII